MAKPSQIGPWTVVTRNRKRWIVSAGLLGYEMNEICECQSVKVTVNKNVNANVNLNMNVTVIENVNKES